MSTYVIEAKGISKSFDAAGAKVLDGLDLSIAKGELVSIVGKSGCGKSTLLYVLSTMDTNYSGELYLDGIRLTGQPEPALARIRNEKIGFVFQFHYLLNEFTVLKNVLLPALKLSRASTQQMEQDALRWLRTLGLEKTIHKYPAQLSGGEKQRVAIARALINSPSLIIADEPTGNLDRQNGENVLRIFRELSSSFSQTILVVTHDLQFAGIADRRIEMEDGRLKQ